MSEEFCAYMWIMTGRRYVESSSVKEGGKLSLTLEKIDRYNQIHICILQMMTLSHLF